MQEVLAQRVFNSPEPSTHSLFLPVLLVVAAGTVRGLYPTDLIGTFE
jgi:hypothetical protein